MYKNHLLKITAENDAVLGLAILYEGPGWQQLY